MTLTIQQLQGFIALIIKSNRAGVIQSLRDAGYEVNNDIAGNNLLTKVLSIYDQKGLAEVTRILSTVRIDESNLSEAERSALFNFRMQSAGIPANSQAKITLGDVKNFFGDLLGGSSVTGGGQQQQTSTSAVSPTTLTIVAIVGIILMIIFRKVTFIVVGIIAVVALFTLYGIFAKKTTTIVTGENSTSHGGIGDALASFVAFFA